MAGRDPARWAALCRTEEAAARRSQCGRKPGCGRRVPASAAPCWPCPRRGHVKPTPPAHLEGPGDSAWGLADPPCFARPWGSGLFHTACHMDTARSAARRWLARVAGREPTSEDPPYKLGALESSCSRILRRLSPVVTGRVHSPVTWGPPPSPDSQAPVQHQSPDARIPWAPPSTAWSAQRATRHGEPRTLPTPTAAAGLHGSRSRREVDPDSCRWSAGRGPSVCPAPPALPLRWPSGGDTS